MNERRETQEETKFRIWGQNARETIQENNLAKQARKNRASAHGIESRSGLDHPESAGGDRVGEYHICTDTEK